MVNCVYERQAGRLTNGTLCLREAGRQANQWYTVSTRGRQAGRLTSGTLYLREAGRHANQWYTVSTRGRQAG